MSTDHFTSHNGLRLPTQGFGTYRVTGSPGVQAMRSAIQNGYRLFDSAVNYENEGAVGAAVRAGDAGRDSIVVTSKLPGRHHRRGEAVTAIEESVFRTGLDYIDLFLIHWPNPRVDLYVEAWQGLMQARDQGLVKAIGVCNFMPEHLERLHRETGEMPAVNQIELHPYFPQVGALEFHRKHGILTQAWSPLGRGNDLLDHPVINEIAVAHGISSAQTVLAWHVAVGALALPKAASPHRQRENLAATRVTLAAEDIARITSLGRLDGRTTNQDPDVWEEF